MYCMVYCNVVYYGQVGEGEGGHGACGGGPPVPARRLPHAARHQGKSSQVKSHLSTFSSAVDQQQVDQGRCPGDLRQYIFYQSVDQLLTRSGATPAQLHDYACLVTILITACSSCVH